MEITFDALDVRLRTAILASCVTRETDHMDPAAWGAALTLEGLAHEHLQDCEREALFALDRLLTAFAYSVAVDTPSAHRARYVGRLLACLA